MTFLAKALKEKKRLVEAQKTAIPLAEIIKNISVIKKRPFYKIFSKRYPEKINIIAEVKKASPSRGVLVDNPDLQELLVNYENGGASAISILTEEKYFKGSLDYLTIAKKIVDLPLLRKDFIVDEYEIYQAKAAGADAILLIGEALDIVEITRYLEVARQIDIDVLLEIHSLSTYKKIAHLEGFILGINNRNLETLRVDLSISQGIIENIPDSLPVIVESGIEERRHIEEFIKYGVSGFLIGTSLVLSKDPCKKLMEMRVQL